MKPVKNGKLHGKVLTHMRDVAFGNATKVAIHKVLMHAECLRDDESLLHAAEMKRLRKQGLRRRKV